MMCIAMQSCQAEEECQEFHNKRTTLLLQTQQLHWSLNTTAHWSQHDRQVGIQWNCCRDFCFCCSKAYRKSILVQEGDYSYNSKKVLSLVVSSIPFFLPPSNPEYMSVEQNGDPLNSMADTRVMGLKTIKVMLNVEFEAARNESC